jgi:hypothetical protein
MANDRFKRVSTMARPLVRLSRPFDKRSIRLFRLSTSMWERIWNQRKLPCTAAVYTKPLDLADGRQLSICRDSKGRMKIQGRTSLGDKCQVEGSSTRVSYYQNLEARLPWLSCPQWSHSFGVLANHRLVGCHDQNRRRPLTLGSGVGFVTQNATLRK